MDDKTCGWKEYFSYHHEKLMWVPGCQSARGIASTYPGRSRICDWCGKATTDATDAAKHKEKKDGNA